VLIGVVGFGVFAVVPLYATALRVADLVDYRRATHPGVAGIVAVSGECDHAENYDVVCPGRFDAADGSVHGRRVWLMTDYIGYEPGQRVHAHAASATAGRAWADGVKPVWQAWLVFSLLFGSFGVAATIVALVQTVHWLAGLIRPSRSPPVPDASDAGG
jgi:hypothetical protein